MSKYSINAFTRHQQWDYISDTPDGDYITHDIAQYMQDELEQQYGETQFDGQIHPLGG